MRTFFLFEIEPSQVKLIEQMRDSQPPPNKDKKEPKRRIEIYEGDFNQNLAKMLADNPIRETEATFCLLDQRTFECDWASVKAIATHKKGGHKIELFYFFPEGWLNRSIAALKHRKEEKLRMWWGNDKWTDLLDKQGATRAQYVTDRFRSDLKYRHVYPFPIYEKEDEGGRVMYYMIHASDHDEAPVLMSRAYGKALDIKESDEQLEFLKALSDQAQRRAPQ